VQRLSRIADDLLTLARSDSGAMQPRLRNTDLGECAALIVDRLRGKASAKQVDLRLHADSPIAGLFDPDLMERLIWNLAENAIKFTPQGGSVDVSVERQADHARLTVSDSGPGIPSDKLDRVFERFFRLDEARGTPSEAGGSGLGLSITHAIVALHGGEVSAATRPEGGAVFTVRLPLQPSS
jgi:signal transduction histidine kinase